MNFSRCILLLVVGCSRICWAQETAIDTYVKQPDPAFRWSVVSSNESDGMRQIVVDLKSQRWLTEDEVDRPEWQHWLNIAVPSQVKSEVSLLMISGGSNGSEPPKGPSDEIVQLARVTGTVVAELKMVPNQALMFKSDGVRRKEDDLIGYTWDQFLNTGNSRWLARNAMVKSAVRAMDTVQEVVSEDCGLTVGRFVVAGASKRGWTTWLTGAMDDRVAAIVPIVIDVLNVDKSMRHHFAAYGYWAPAVANYVQHRIMERLDHPRISELYNLVDPFAYRERLDMPKLILNAAGDQFFLPDSSQFYFDQLPGESYLRYVANTDHSMRGSDALQTLTAFYFAIAHDIPRPECTWKAMGSTLRVETKNTPQSVVFWKAFNPRARDFRLETLGPKYESKQLSEVADGIYEVDLSTPESGWAAQFVELTFDIGAPTPLKLTTNVFVTPSTLPYAGRQPSLPATVTIKVRTSNGSVAGKLAAAATGLMKTRLGASDAVTQIDGETFYLNWRPNDTEVVRAVIDWLEEQDGVVKTNLQMESGRNITINSDVAPVK